MIIRRHYRIQNTVHILKYSTHTEIISKNYKRCVNFKLKMINRKKRLIGKSLIGYNGNRLQSLFEIWHLIGKSLDRRLRDRRKSVGKSLVGACAIGECLETAKKGIISTAGC